MSFAVCQSGSWCDGSAGACETFLADGADCSGIGTGECNFNDGKTCLNDLTCGAKLDVGGTCTDAGDCLSASCDVVNGCNAPDNAALCGFIVN